MTVGSELGVMLEKWREAKRGVQLSQVVHSSGCESHLGKVGQPPSSKHRAGGSNPKC